MDHLQFDCDFSSTTGDSICAEGFQMVGIHLNGNSIHPLFSSDGNVIGNIFCLLDGNGVMRFFIRMAEPSDAELYLNSGKSSFLSPSTLSGAELVRKFYRADGKNQIPASHLVFVTDANGAVGIFERPVGGSEYEKERFQRSRAA